MCVYTLIWYNYVKCCVHLLLRFLSALNTCLYTKGKKALKWKHHFTFYELCHDSFWITVYRRKKRKKAEKQNRDRCGLCILIYSILVQIVLRSDWRMCVVCVKPSLILSSRWYNAGNNSSLEWFIEQRKDAVVTHKSETRMTANSVLLNPSCVWILLVTQLNVPLIHRATANAPDVCRQCILQRQLAV